MDKKELAFSVARVAEEAGRMIWCGTPSAGVCQRGSCQFCNQYGYCLPILFVGEVIAVVAWCAGHGGRTRITRSFCRDTAGLSIRLTGLPIICTITVILPYQLRW